MTVRELTGLALAPLAVVAPMLIYVVASTPGLITSGRPLAGLSTAAFYAIVAVAVSYAYTAIAGIPAHFFLKARGRNALKDYVLTGFGLCALPLLAYFLYVVALETRDWNLLRPMARNGSAFARSILLFGVCGGTVAGAFWRLAVR